MKDFRILFIYPNTMMATLVPLHISLLSSCLKQDGFQVDLFDTTCYRTEEINFEQKKVELLQVKKFNLEEQGVVFKETNLYDDLVERVRNYKPDLIAITIVEDTYDLAISLLDAIEDLDIPTIAGGVFVTVSPQEVMNNGTIDIVCVGEGEEALVELCNKMYKGKDYSGVENLWVKKDGKIFKNKLRTITDINKLPFIDYDIFEPNRLCRPMYGKIYVMLHVELDRGCPYECTYCGAPQLKRFYRENNCGVYHRRKTVDRIMKEMKWLFEKYIPDYVNFNSESFLARPLEELFEFASRYKREINLPFWCQSRPETVTEEKIKILKDMNCQNLQFGIEHGNEDFRAKVLNRYCSNERIISALKLVEKYDINYTVNNIIGFPDETRELIFQTVDINRKINPTTINCYLFTPYKGTLLYDYCIKKGYLDKNDKVHQLLDSVELKMGSIAYEELKGLQRTFPLYSKMPVSEWDMIRKAERFDEEGNRVFAKLRGIYYEKYFK